MGEAVLLNRIEVMTDMNTPFDAYGRALCPAQPASNAVRLIESNISAADLPEGQVCSHEEKPSELSHRAFLFIWDNLFRLGRWSLLRFFLRVIRFVVVL